MDRTTSVHHLLSYALPLVGAIVLSSLINDTRTLRIAIEAGMGYLCNGSVS
jgi:hypothetical protein